MVSKTQSVSQVRHDMLKTDSDSMADLKFCYHSVSITTQDTFDIADPG